MQHNKLLLLLELTFLLKQRPVVKHLRVWPLNVNVRVWPAVAGNWT